VRGSELNGCCKEREGVEKGGIQRECEKRKKIGRDGEEKCTQIEKEIESKKEDKKYGTQT
jgi:hypothetical protein